MGNEKKNKKNTREEPAFDNDQIGENASEEYAEDYMQKGRTAQSQNKQKK